MNGLVKPKLVRITTLPVSMKVLLKGQVNFMKQQGFAVWMVSANGADVAALQNQENAPHIAIPFTRKMNPLKDLICLVRLTVLLLKIKPHIVHTHTPKAGLIGMWAAFFAGVPVRLHTIAGLPWVEYKGWVKKILILIEKVTAIPASAVYPNSKEQMAFMLSHSIAVKKLKVIGNGSSNGIDTDYFSKTPHFIKLGNQLRLDCKVVDQGWIWIFIGRVVKEKGMGELLFAFEKLYQQFPFDQLWLLGEEEPELDPLTPSQKKIIDEHPAIKCWGFVNDIRVHLAAADALLFPSYREGFPNVPMQAGAMECAMILSNINGCNEIVQDKDNGLLVPVKDAQKLYESMLFLRKNTALREEFSKKIRFSIETKYSQSNLWQHLLDEYIFQLQKKNLPLP